MMPLIHARKIFPTQGSYNVFRFLVCCLFGAWQSKEFPDGKEGSRSVSLTRYRPFREGIFQLPAKLFETKDAIEAAIRNSVTDQKTPDEIVQKATNSTPITSDQYGRELRSQGLPEIIHAGALEASTLIPVM
jgi:hypothetical protein